MVKLAMVDLLQESPFAELRIGPAKPRAVKSEYEEDAEPPAFESEFDN